MLENLVRQKKDISAKLEELLALQERESIQSSPWMRDGIPRVLDYTRRGKMIRGALVDLGFRMYQDSRETRDSRQVILSVASAMELFQSMLLIHDDVMDQDELRRGKPSVHVQYRELCQAQGLRDARHAGESLAICAGDVAAFQAFEILSGLDIPPVRALALTRLFSRELAYVGYAQMEDVHNSLALSELDTALILQVYRFKTGRYTFSLPLMAGAILAGSDPGSLGDLARLGELLGLIFQIRDDHIGLFGQEEKTGKPAGSDIRENKKTLHRAALMEASDISDRPVMESIFGNPQCTPQDVETILRMMESRGVLDRISDELDHYARECRVLIARLPMSREQVRTEILEVLEYNLHRES